MLDLARKYDLTSLEASALLRVSPQTMYRWRTRKFGPKCIKVGGEWRYSGEEIQSWLVEYNEWLKKAL